MLDDSVGDLSDSAIYDVLATSGVLAMMSGYDVVALDKADDKYVVKGLSYARSATFYRWLIPVLCGPGKVGLTCVYTL